MIFSLKNKKMTSNTSYLIICVLVVYILLTVRYYYRTSSNLEIIQLPEDGFDISEWNSSIETRNPIIFFLDIDLTLTATFSKINFGPELITCISGNQLVKMPGLEFEKLCRDTESHSDFKNIYFKSKSTQIKNIFEPYLSTLSNSLIGSGYSLIYPKSCGSLLEQTKSYLLWYQTDGNCKLLLFPNNESNKKILSKKLHDNPNLNFWRDKERLDGTNYIEIVLNPTQVLAIPPHWWYTVDSQTTSVVFQVNDIRF